MPTRFAADNADRAATPTAAAGLVVARLVSRSRLSGGVSSEGREGIQRRRCLLARGRYGCSSWVFEAACEGWEETGAGGVAIARWWHEGGR